MRVNIDEIKESGLARSWEVPREQVDEMLAGDRAGYRARGAARVEVRLEKLERRIRVAGSVRAELTAACGRCLKPVSVDVPADFELTLVPADEGERLPPHGGKDQDMGLVGGSFAPEQAEEETYSGKVIDLDPFAREQILLALPPYPICAESCRGLCPVCGGNLNERECGCDRRVPDPRWAGLEKLRGK